MTIAYRLLCASALHNHCITNILIMSCKANDLEANIQVLIYLVFPKRTDEINSPFEIS